MTVRIVQLETTLAASALADKLAEAGFVAESTNPQRKAFAIKVQDENAERLADLLASFATSEWLYSYIAERMSASHSYLTDDEREYVSLLTFHGLRKHSDDLPEAASSEWREAVRATVTAVLGGEDPPHLSIDGVMRFRARACLTVADTAIHEMVEQFLADREYEEFVSMLRYMLEAQPPSTQVLHVYCADDRVWLTDEAGQLVKDSEVSRAAQQATEGGAVNQEDLTMSILITRSPCSIIIHDLMSAPAWPSFAETLERVFLDRAVRCQQCTTCAQLHRAEESLRNPELNHKSAMPDKYE